MKAKTISIIHELLRDLDTELGFLDSAFHGILEIGSDKKINKKEKLKQLKHDFVLLREQVKDARVIAGRIYEHISTAEKNLKQAEKPCIPYDFSTQDYDDE